MNTRNNATQTIVDTFKGFQIVEVENTHWDRIHTEIHQNGECVKCVFEDEDPKEKINWLIEDQINTNMRNGQFDNQSLMGMWVSQVLWTDVRCIGKIVGTYGKTGIIVEPWRAVENKTKMEWISGGFAGHCVNNLDQEWTFEKLEGEENERFRLGKGFNKERYRINFNPRYYRDFNF